MSCLYDVETARNKWTEIAHYLQQDGIALGADSQGAQVSTHTPVQMFPDAVRTAAATPPAST